MTSHFKCPSCSQNLVKTNAGVGILWLCPGCEGRAVTIGFLRRGVQTEFLNRIWHQARENHATQKIGPRSCPSCTQKMPIAIVPGADETQLVLDVCPTCQFVWLDAGEAAQMPIRPPDVAPSVRSISPEEKQAAAIAQVERMGERIRREERGNNPTGNVIGDFLEWILLHGRW